MPRHAGCMGHVIRAQGRALLGASSKHKQALPLSRPLFSAKILNLHSNLHIFHVSRATAANHSGMSQSPGMQLQHMQNTDLITAYPAYALCISAYALAGRTRFVVSGSLPTRIFGDFSE